MTMTVPPAGLDLQHNMGMPSGVPKPSNRHPKSSEARRQELLLAVMNGERLRAAMTRLRIAERVYFDWRKKIPEFAAKMDQARLMGKLDPNEWQGDFASFRKTFLGMDTYLHMHEIVRILTLAKPGSVTLVLVPPEHGKTTLLEDFCNYRIATDPDVRITICSEGQPHARKILRRIASRMEDPTKAPAYVQRFGPFRPPEREIAKPWSADFLTVVRASHDERDYTLEARGWRSSVAGTRTDLLIVDDIQSARSLNQTDQMLDTFRQDFLTRPGRTGHTVVVGTRVGVGDFYERLITENIVDEIVEFPAINERGEALCPELWPADALRRRREQVGEDVWWRNYMQQPRRSGTQTFTTKMCETARDLSRSIGETRGTIDHVVGIDPAISGRTAFVACGYNGDELQICEAESLLNLGSVEAICGHVERYAARYRPSTIVVEGNAFQRGLIYDERLNQLAGQYGFRIVEHTTHRNKLDENIGVARMPTSFVAGQVSTPWRDEVAVAMMSQLEIELQNWRPNIPGTRLRQDLVMALWFCWLHWRRWRDVSPVHGISVRRPALPWAPTANPMRARVG